MLNNKGPMYFVGAQQSDDLYHDGRLRPVVGVHSFQAFRSNRELPEAADMMGWTYINQQAMTWWQGKFYIQYIANKVGEHQQGAQALLLSSIDGKKWLSPEVIFPKYELSDGTLSELHHRMGFYIAENGKLLTLGFYGRYPTPNDGTGIGRVVREIYSDGTYGPIYFIRYNHQMGYNESNTYYPRFDKSTDSGFIAACQELLCNKLITLQWWEEEQSDDGFYMLQGGKAMSYFRRKDGKIAAIWKGAVAATSEDEGNTWSEVLQCDNVITNGAKVWIQKNSDGRYSMTYNPTVNNNNRWPLAVSLSDDGVCFDQLLLVEGEVPPVRYQGNCKTPGLQYVRGIEQLVEMGDRVPHKDMWLCQAMNKEDIWVHQVPVPIRGKVYEDVHDTFEDMGAGGKIKDWNIYSGIWCPVTLVKLPDTDNVYLELRDKDPYDYARALRVFKESKKVDISFDVLAEQDEWGWLEIDVLNAVGDRPIQITLDSNGLVLYAHGIKKTVASKYKAGGWIHIDIKIDAIKSLYELTINEILCGKEIAMLIPVDSVERLCFRTGAYRTRASSEVTHMHHHLQYNDPSSKLKTIYKEEIIRHKSDLPNAGIPEKEAVYRVDNVFICGR